MSIRAETRGGRRVVSGADLCRCVGAPVERLDAYVEETINLDPWQIGDDWIVADDEDGGTVWLACIPVFYFASELQDEGYHFDASLIRTLYAIFGLDKQPRGSGGSVSLTTAMERRHK